MTATPETSVRDVVAEDFRTAAVLERFGINFCCGARRTLGEACRDRDVSPLDVLVEMSEACERQGADLPRFARWGADALITYIVHHHHGYVRRVLPSIVAHATKVAGPHGANRPELIQIA